MINLFLFKYQVCKLIDDSEKSKNPKVNISQDVITEWLLQNKVLSIAFESKFTILLNFSTMVHLCIRTVY